jgi:Ca2+-transporting ATPase
MFYKKDTLEIFDTFKTSFSGLSSNEATNRLRQYGYNELQGKKAIPVWKLFLEAFKDPLVIILLIAALIQIFLGEVADSVIIFIVLILNAILGVTQTRKAETSLASLKKLSSPNAKVIRNGNKMVIPARQIVPGDVMILEAGDYILADGKIIEAQTLKVMEGMLTGESEAVLKNSNTILVDVPLGDRLNMVYSGSTVVYGRGLAVAVATGMETEIGKIAGLLEEATSDETPLQRSLKTFSKKLGFWIIILCILIFAVMTIKGLRESQNYFYIISKSFMFAIAVAVAAIPEALSSIVTIVLSAGTIIMAKQHAIIRKLPAVETLGCTGIICTDKTGTLTQNKMTVVDFFLYGIKNPTFGENLGTHEKFFLLSTGLPNDAHVDVSGKEIGDPTEIALINFGLKNSKDFAFFREKFKRLAELPFDSDRKIMSTVNSLNGETLMFSKGAPDIILKRCTHVLDNGLEIPLDDSIKNIYIVENEKFSERALRVLAVTYKKVPTNFVPTVDDENNLTLVGLVAMIDPPRDGVVEAIAQAKSAGIKPIMITGDHKVTATAIAKEIGLMEVGEKSLTGMELDQLTEEQLEKDLEQIAVYARVSPENKIRIVKAWQKKGKITAMTGDGVNDAPALKQADIGIAMGTGTDVAKDASAMILTDDNFATIVHSIKIGRTVYSNIKKSINYLFAGNFGAIIAIFFALLVGWSNPFTPLQLLFINLVNDSLPAIALGLENPEKNIMKEPPRSSKASLFPIGSIISVTIKGILIGGAAIIAQFLGNNISVELGAAMAFTTIIFARILQIIPARSEKNLAIQLGFFSNKYILIAIIICFAVYTICLIPYLRSIFNIPAIFGLKEILTCFILSFIAMLLMELEKFILK